MQDLGNIRVAAGRKFDIILSKKTKDFSSFKENKKKGVEANKGTLTFKVDKPEMLEWKAEYPDFTTYGFRQLVDVDGAKIGCWPMHGVNKKGMLRVYKNACKTIAKE